MPYLIVYYVYHYKCNLSQLHVHQHPVRDWEVLTTNSQLVGDNKPPCVSMRHCSWFTLAAYTVEDCINDARYMTARDMYM